VPPLCNRKADRPVHRKRNGRQAISSVITIASMAKLPCAAFVFAHPGQAYSASRALAERLRGTADRIDPARVLRSSFRARLTWIGSCKLTPAITTKSGSTVTGRLVAFQMAEITIARQMFQEVFCG
jgi:hypothetical protein